MLVSDYIIDFLLKELNINTYFLITGGAIVPFVNQLSLSEKIKYYTFQHEQSAAIAAEGYYRASGKLACVVTTSGPGVQNILNGVCGCWYDSIPALFITGQVNTKESLDSIASKPRQLGFQEMPVVDTFNNFTKYSVKLDSIEKIQDSLYKCKKELLTPRFGPCLIDLPVNIQMTDFVPVINYDYKIITQQNFNVDFQKINEYIEKSSRPLLVLGNGIKLSKSEKLIHDIVDTLDIPFVLSWGGYDIFDSTHKLRVGSHGVYGDRWANFAIQNADLLFIIGSRMDTRQTGGNLSYFSKFSKKIMVDIDENEINKLDERGVNIDVKCLCDIYWFLKNINIEKKECNEWKNKIIEWKIKFSDEPKRDGVYEIMPEIFEKLENDCIIIPDQGGNLIWTMQNAFLKEKQKLFTNLGNSSMGYALPCAIGAAIASNKKIICIDGDGGFQMNIQELLTVKKYNLQITTIILNNSGYGIIKQFQDAYFNSNYSATTKSDVFGEYGVNFLQVANAYGLESTSHYEEFSLDNRLYDIKINENQKIYPKLEFGNSLENMSPYLDQEELEKELLVKFPNKINQTGWVKI